MSGVNSVFVLTVDSHLYDRLNPRHNGILPDLQQSFLSRPRWCQQGLHCCPSESFSSHVCHENVTKLPVVCSIMYACTCVNIFIYAKEAETTIKQIRIMYARM